MHDWWLAQVCKLRVGQQGSCQSSSTLRVAIDRLHGTQRDSPWGTLLAGEGLPQRTDLNGVSQRSACSIKKSISEASKGGVSQGAQNTKILKNETLRSFQPKLMTPGQVGVTNIINRSE